MNKASFFLCSILFASFTHPFPAASEDCECYGAVLGGHKGGNGAPLNWTYAASLIRSGSGGEPPALVCYLKKVVNASNSQVRNIRWDVADFRRRFIPAQDTADSCPTLPGEIGPEPKAGPLTYGISTDAYETTVIQPRAGWKQVALPDTKSDWPLIRSVFNVNVSDKEAAQIVIYSSVTVPARQVNDIRSNVLNYEIENRGAAGVLFLANLLANEAILKDVPFVKEFFVSPGKRSSFHVAIHEPVQPQSATIVISDPKTNQALAVEAAGFYGPTDGKRIYSDQALIERIQ